MKPVCEAIVEELAGYEAIVEIGIGRRPEVARALAARGRDVTATDIYPHETPENVAFALDDVTDPEPGIYTGVEAIYALNCPPELHRHVRALAHRVDTAFLFTTLGTDPPMIPVSRIPLPTETLFIAKR